MFGREGLWNAKVGRKSGTAGGRKRKMRAGGKISFKKIAPPGAGPGGAKKSRKGEIAQLPAHRGADLGAELGHCFFLLGGEQFLLDPV